MAPPKILIADDDPSVAEVLVNILEVCGYASEIAGDGDEVLAKAESCNPDLILLDVTMPKKDGYEVLKILQSNKKTMDIPVIMITGRAAVCDKVEGLHLGAGDYLTKPFSPDELVARIRVLLKHKQGSEEKIKAEKLLALSTMLDGLAHEVRNPVTVIGGFARILLKKTLPDDPRYRYMKVIAREVGRLERMMSDINVLKGLNVQRVTVAVGNSLVRQALQTMTGTLTGKHISLSLNLEPDRTKLLVDSGYFKMGIRNIVQNAIDAMPEGGRLKVTTRRSPEHFFIHVVDTGCGIKEEQLHYIFDPFFTSKMEGTGLGLTVAMKAIQAHGGTISARSTPGYGTEVVIECPIAGPEITGAAL